MKQIKEPNKENVQESPKAENTPSADRPSVNEIEKELLRLQKKQSRNRNIRYIIALAAVAAATIIIVTNIWLPVLKIVGSSMQPSIQNNDVVVCYSGTKQIDYGDIIAFYNNDNVLLKRVVGMENDVIDINEAGEVFVNGQLIDEPYAYSKSLEPCDIEFPVTVPKDSFFVLGDQRNTSHDSRTSSVGMIPVERIIGEVILRVWPIEHIDFL